MSEISEKAKGLIYNLKYREYTTRNTPTRWNKNLEKTARAELDNYIAELSQALGLITTLKPTMVMDADHPLEMAKEVVEYVTARIAELEALVERLIEAGNWLNAMHEDGVFVDELNAARTSWKLAVSDWQSMPSHVTNPLESQGIVTRNGGEG